jgi:hypothetical protein
MISARSAVRSPRRFAPSSNSIAIAGEGVVVARSLERSSTSFTGRFNRSAAAAASGSISPPLPPKPPPTAMGTIRIAAGDSSRIEASCARTSNWP